jgi:hypothetical protein
MDNDFLIEMFRSYPKSEDNIVIKDEAFQYIRPYIELTPVYVYNAERKKYILCGKLDSQFGVSAVHGEIVELNKLK